MFPTRWGSRQPWQQPVFPLNPIKIRSWQDGAFGAASCNRREEASRAAETIPSPRLRLLLGSGLRMAPGADLQKPNELHRAKTFPFSVRPWVGKHRGCGWQPGRWLEGREDAAPQAAPGQQQFQLSCNFAHGETLKCWNDPVN